MEDDPLGIEEPTPHLLLVYATAGEAEPLVAALAPTRSVPVGWGSAVATVWHQRRVVLAELGVGKVNTAAGLALLLHALRPARVLQFGIGGAFAGSFVGVGGVAVASTELHTDTGAGEGEGWQDMRSLGFPLIAGAQPIYNEIPTDPVWSAEVATAAAAPLLRFATSERVTADFASGDALEQRFGVAVESMEGAAAAQVCFALGVPFAEVRGISNIVGERNKRAWDVRGAVWAAHRAVMAVLDRLATSAPGLDADGGRARTSPGREP